MAIGDIIVGVDIGTEKVTAVVGEINSFNQIKLICTTSSKTLGIKKTKIINEEEVAKSIREAIEEAENLAELKINSSYTTIPGTYVTIVQNSITKEVKDKYAGISVKDVSTGINQVKDIEIPDDKVSIDVFPSQFTLENGKVIEDPVGNISGSFSVKGQVMLADKEYVKQLTSVFKKAGLEIDGIIPTILAQRNLILDTNELNDNVIVLDIGAGNTNIGAFEGNELIYTNTIPIGGDSITSDIAYILNIEEQEAEKLKKQYGLALKSFIDNDTDVILNTCKDETTSKTIKSSELIEIIEARIEEIFSLVNKDISKKGFKQKINNVILTGQGITTINKSDVAGKIILNIPVKIATGRLISTIKTEYRTSYALVRYIAAKPYIKTVASKTNSKEEKNIFKSVIEKVKNFFYT